MCVSCGVWVRGGQGVVYLCERPGADGFTLPVALKLFSPERYRTSENYDLAMQRMSRVAALIARIQHENLLVVQNMVDRNRIRMMLMEYVEGFDLKQLTSSNTLHVTSRGLSEEKQRYLERVLFTQGPPTPSPPTPLPQRGEGSPNSKRDLTNRECHTLNLPSPLWGRGVGGEGVKSWPLNKTHPRFMAPHPFPLAKSHALFSYIESG
jgi:serine/threonine protein kinase